MRTGFVALGLVLAGLLSGCNYAYDPHLDSPGPPQVLHPAGSRDIAADLEESATGGRGMAIWWPDPAYPPPAPATTDLHVLVAEGACSSGSYATGRVTPPVVSYAETSITITFRVRGRRGDGNGFNCIGNPGTPTILQLPEPVGERQLLDGGVQPPRVAAPY